MRLEAESYGDHETAEFINSSFVPFTCNLHEKAGLFGRFNAAWTPTILVLTPRAAEVFRIEGYLPKSAFRAHLEMARARVAFMTKQFADAEARYEALSTEPLFEPEAMYWSAVSRYSASHDSSHLQKVARELRESFPGAIWTIKSSVWLPAGG